VAGDSGGFVVGVGVRCKLHGNSTRVGEQAKKKGSENTSKRKAQGSFKCLRRSRVNKGNLLARWEGVKRPSRSKR
jgi:hypothetical protein